MTPTDLPDAELELLAALVRRGEATARELREDLAPHRPMTHGAVLSLVRRLEAKGCLARTDRKVGKAFVYGPVGQPERTLRRRLEALSERLFGGDPVGLVSALFGGRPPTHEQVEGLEALLDDLRRRVEGKGPR